MFIEYSLSVVLKIGNKVVKIGLKITFLFIDLNCIWNNESKNKKKFEKYCVLDIEIKVNVPGFSNNYFLFIFIAWLYCNNSSNSDFYIHSSNRNEIQGKFWELSGFFTHYGCGIVPAWELDKWSTTSTVFDFLYKVMKWNSIFFNTISILESIKWKNAFISLIWFQNSWIYYNHMKFCNIIIDKQPESVDTLQI